MEQPSWWAQNRQSEPRQPPQQPAPKVAFEECISRVLAKGQSRLAGPFLWQQCGRFYKTSVVVPTMVLSETSGLEPGPTALLGYPRCQHAPPCAAAFGPRLSIVPSSPCKIK